jgi:hypothetical protein
MSIFVVAAFAACVSALASLTLVGLHLFNTLRSLRYEREKYNGLHPPMTATFDPNLLVSKQPLTLPESEAASGTDQVKFPLVNVSERIKVDEYIRKSG